MQAQQVRIPQVDNPDFMFRDPTTASGSIVKSDLVHIPDSTQDVRKYGLATPGKPNSNTIKFSLGSKDVFYEAGTMSLLLDVEWFNLRGCPLQYDGGNHALLRSIRIFEEQGVEFEKVNGLNEWINLVDQMAGGYNPDNVLWEKQIGPATEDFAPRNQGYGMNAAVPQITARKKTIRIPLRGSSFLKQIGKYIPCPLLKRWLNVEVELEQPCRAVVPAVHAGKVIDLQLFARFATNSSVGTLLASTHYPIVYNDATNSVLVANQTSGGNGFQTQFWADLFNALCGSTSGMDGHTLIMTVGNVHVPFVVKKVYPNAITDGSDAATTQAAVNAALRRTGNSGVVMPGALANWVVVPYLKQQFTDTTDPGTNKAVGPWEWLARNISDVLISQYQASLVSGQTSTYSLTAQPIIVGSSVTGVPFNIRFTAYPRHVFHGDTGPVALPASASAVQALSFSNLLNLPYYEITNARLECRAVRPAFESMNKLIQKFDSPQGMAIPMITLKRQFQALPANFVGQQQFPIPLSERSLKYLIVVLKPRAANDGDASRYSSWNTPCLSQFVRAGLRSMALQIGSTTYPINGQAITFDDLQYNEQQVLQLRTLLDAFGQQSIGRARRSELYHMNYLGDQRAQTRTYPYSASTVACATDYVTDTPPNARQQIYDSRDPEAPFDQTNFGVIINLQKFTGFLDGLDVTGTANLILKLDFLKQAGIQVDSNSLPSTAGRPIDLCVYQVGEALAVLSKNANRVMS